MSRHRDSLLSWTKTCYGAVLSGGQVRILHAAWGQGGVVHSSVDPASASFQADLAAGRAIVVSCLSVEESFVRPVEVPFPSVKKAQKVFPSVLDVQLPFSLEACVCRFVDVRVTPERRTCGLAVAARREDIEAKLGELGRHGVDPIVLDHEGLALWTQSNAEIPCLPDAVRVVLCLEAEYTVLVIGRGTEFLGTHAVRGRDPCAIQRVLRARLPADEHAILQYAWCGPGSRDADTVARFRQELDGGSVAEHVTHDQPEDLLLRALTTRALVGHPLACDLRVGSLAHPRLVQERLGRRLRAATVCLAAGMLLCLANAVWGRLVQQRIGEWDQRVSALAHRLAPRGRIQPFEEVRAAERAVSARETALAPFARAFAPSLSRRLVELLRTSAEACVRINQVAVDSASVRIHGTAEEWGACERLLPMLKGDGYEPKMEREEPVDGERMRFTITAGGGHE